MNLWIEQYRPHELKDVIFSDTSYRGIFQKMIGDETIPHLLFTGPAGTGKTTLAKILASKVTEDVMYINASDENDVNTIRNKVKDFSTSVGFSDIRVILLDEADYLSPNAQACLRNLMEEYHKYARFILTANFPNKIIDPLVSRCQHFKFAGAEKKDIAKRACQILKDEGIKFIPKQLIPYVNEHGSDIRGLLGNLQKNTVDGELGEFSSLTTNVNDYISLINEKDFTTFKAKFMKDNIDPHEMLHNMFHNADKIGDDSVQVMLAVGEGLRWHANVTDPQINMLTTVIEVMTLI